MAGLLLGLTLSAAAAEPAAEIEYLLHAVGDSGCEFIRNGTNHDAADAEAHLRMKYDRGRRWVKTTEQFIERIASESSWSGEPYQIHCDATAPGPTRDWLRARLTEYRAGS